MILHLAAAAAPTATPASHVVKEIHDNLGLIAGIITSLITIFALRKQLMRLLRGIWYGVRIPVMLVHKLEKMDTILMDVQHQLHTNNGSSLKDAITRVETAVAGLSGTSSMLEEYRKNTFWREPRPSIEMNHDGQVVLVSEAACRLVKVSDPQTLHRRSWLQFLDGKHVEELLHSFRDTAATKSLFRFAINVYDEGGESRGLWDFKAAPIGADLYSGYFSPADAAAKEIAGRCGWLKQ